MDPVGSIGKFDVFGWGRELDWLQILPVGWESFKVDVRPFAEHVKAFVNIQGV